MSTDKKLTGNQLKFLLVMGIIVVIMYVMLQGIVNNIFPNINDPIPMVLPQLHQRSQVRVLLYNNLLK